MSRRVDRLDLRLDPAIAEMDRVRGHRFAPPANHLRSVPAIKATEHDTDPMVWLHYFAGGWDWFVTELDPETYKAFGYVRSPLEPRGELGYIDLVELATLKVPSARMRLGGQERTISTPVERDCYWSPSPLSEVRR